MQAARVALIVTAAGALRGGAGTGDIPRAETGAGVHAGPPNEGFTGVTTADDLGHQEWGTPVGPVGMNSPVLGTGYEIYLGTLNGELFKLVRPGTIAWKVIPAPGEIITGS